MPSWVQSRSAQVGQVAMAAVLLFACGHAASIQTEPATTVIAGVVPWADIPAPDVAKPVTITAIPPCRTADLSIKVQAPPSYIGAGPRNTSMWSVTFSDQSSGRCFVGSSFDVGFASAGGIMNISPDRLGGNIIYLAPASGPPPAPPFWSQAVGEIDTFPCTIPRVTSMTISPGPSLGSLTVDPGPAGGWGALCPGTKETYVAELSPNCTGAAPGCVGYASNAETAISAPTSVHPGESLRFTITITNRPSPRLGTLGPNPAPSPITFQNCPTYHEELEGVIGSFTHSG